MTRPDLSQLADLLQRASLPEEVFGPLSGEPLAALKRRYRELVSLVHPDHNTARAIEATEAFKALQTWYAAALRQVKQGSYGATPHISAAGRLHHYVGHLSPLQGDLAELFPASADGRAVLLKVAAQVANNDLLQAEARALSHIARKLEGQQVRAHFPTLIESFLLRDESGALRHTNVLLAEEAYYSLEQVLRAYPAGIALGDAAWMFNRLLAAVGVTHSLGLVHGAVLPGHLLIRPSDHNGMLIDWCYSVPQGERLKALSPAYAADYPPEVAAGQPATPASDLFTAARCLSRLLGGKGPNLELPPSVPRSVRALLRACLLPSPHRRPGDAWQLYDDFQAILLRLYGPRRFRPFQMPA